MGRYCNVIWSWYTHTTCVSVQYHDNSPPDIIRLTKIGEPNYYNSHVEFLNKI